MTRPRTARKPTPRPHLDDAAGTAGRAPSERDNTRTQPTKADSDAQKPPDQATTTGRAQPTDTDAHSPRGEATTSMHAVGDADTGASIGTTTTILPGGDSASEGKEGESTEADVATTIPPDDDADADVDRGESTGTGTDTEVGVTAEAERPDEAGASHKGQGGEPAGGAAAATRRREMLEAERDFLLTSLRDLAAEHAAGELDDDQHDALASRYSARAARVLRALDAAPESTAGTESPGSRPSWRRRAAVLVPLVGVLAAGSLLLPSALSDRDRGQTITGNAQSGGDTRASIEQALSETPEDPTAHRAYARLLLEDGDLVGALQHYDATARLDPRDAESQAYAGWIVALAGLTDEALERLDAAIAADPTYPDAHFFRGVALRDKGDTAGATTELRRYLELAPDSPLRPQVEQLIQDLDGAPPEQGR